VPEIAWAHHEKLDGSGYPNRLTADQIPLQSKMMAIADIFDALTAAGVRSAARFTRLTRTATPATPTSTPPTRRK